MQMVSPAVGYALWTIFSSSQKHQVLRQSGLQKVAIRSCATTPSALCLPRKCHRIRASIGVKKNPFQLNELRERLGGTSIRCLSSASEPITGKPLQMSLDEMNKEKWLPVYRFKGVHKYVFISKLKMFQTVASLLYVPYAYYRLLNEEINPETFNIIISASVFATLMLYVFSRSFGRIIGVISINSNRNIVRIGHINFLGGRRNVFADVEDVVPLSESLEPSGRFVKLSRYSNSDNYLLLATTEVEIVDEELSAHIFGTNAYFDELLQSDKSVKEGEREKDKEK